MSENAPAPSPGSVFRAEGLRKDYDDGQVQALRGVNFDIAERELVAITGPSGCGKSTLLQLLGALDRPTAGDLLYRGQSLAQREDLALYRSQEIGFVFQSFHLLPTFTAEENVQMPMFEGKLSRGERESKARELLAAVGLAARRQHFPGKLSGGERQRVAIARSLANDPKVLLADEPTGNLDTKSAHSVLDLLSRLHEERAMTMVLITHDLSVARRATRAIQMKDGQVVFDGAPAQLPPPTQE
jgi:putative ABC transport system ATP-binding protein